jgi:dTDP-4-amino-4,6-dideoxygalactose transaminase
MSNSYSSITATVPFVDLTASHLEVAAEVQAGIDSVIKDAAFINGADVKRFEDEYSAFTGVPYCIGVANGTDAIELALRAVGIADGSKVLLPANTFVATAEAVVRAGGRPVFGDVDPDHLLLDPASLRSADRELKAVVPVHLYGQMAPMDDIVAETGERGIPVIEDAAQAHGAAQHGRPAGSLGLMAAVSFYPGKNLGAYGDAGAVLTTSADLARVVRLLGDHGSEQKYEHTCLGFNSRLDTLQATVLRAKLPRLAQWNAARQLAARRYDDLLSDLDDVTLPQVMSGNKHVWHLYVIRVPRRNHVLRCLHEDGVRAAIHYPVPVHLQPAFRHFGYRPGDFPVAESAAEHLLSLPLYPQITIEQQQQVAASLRSALRRSGGPGNKVVN